MDAVRLIVGTLLIEAAESLRRRMEEQAAATDRPYDAYSLADRPLPAGLRLFPHPRGVSEEAARRITAGAIG